MKLLTFDLPKDSPDPVLAHALETVRRLYRVNHQYLREVHRTDARLD